MGDDRLLTLTSDDVGWLNCAVHLVTSMHFPDVVKGGVEGFAAMQNALTRLANVIPEIERLQLSLAQVRAEQVKLMRWKRRWDMLSEMLGDPENTFQDADGVLEVMGAMEGGWNPDG